MAEVERLPAGMLEEVCDARAYMHAKHMYETTERQQDLPKHWPMLDEVRKIDLEIAATLIAEKKADKGDG